MYANYIPVISEKVPLDAASDSVAFGKQSGPASARRLFLMVRRARSGTESQPVQTRRQMKGFCGAPRNGDYGMTFSFSESSPLSG